MTRGRRILVATVIAGVVLVGAWYYLGAASPSVLLDELLHPVAPGISLNVEVANKSAVPSPRMALVTPTRTLPVESLAAGAQRVFAVSDPDYGSILLKDVSTGSTYGVLLPDDGATGVGGELRIWLGDVITPEAPMGSVDGRFRVAPWRWEQQSGVWPLMPYSP